MMAAITTTTTTFVGQHMPGADTEKEPAVTTSSMMTPDKIRSITDFMLYQAQTIPDTPLIAYPSTELGAADFVDYTASQLDSFADEAAKWLSVQGLKPSVSLQGPNL